MSILIFPPTKEGKAVDKNRSDYILTMKSMLCGSRTYEKMQQEITNRVHPDIRRVVEKINDQLTAQSMQELAQTIPDIIGSISSKPSSMVLISNTKPLLTVYR